MIRMALGGIQHYRQTLVFSSDKTTFLMTPKNGSICPSAKFIIP